MMHDTKLCRLGSILYRGLPFVPLERKRGISNRKYEAFSNGTCPDPKQPVWPSTFQSRSKVLVSASYQRLGSEKDIPVAIDFAGTGIPIWIWCWNNK